MAGGRGRPRSCIMAVLAWSAWWASVARTAPSRQDDAVGYLRGLDLADEPPSRRIGAPATILNVSAAGERTRTSFPETRTSLGTTGAGVFRACTLDRRALALQREFDHLARCGCECTGGVPPRAPAAPCPHLSWGHPQACVMRAHMRSLFGIGAEIGSLFKPFANAYATQQAFDDAEYSRPGLRKPSLSASLDTRPTLECSGGRVHDPRATAVVSATGRSAVMEARVPSPHDRYASLFWWTSMVAARLLRPTREALERARAAQRAMGWSRGQRVLGLHVRHGDTCLTRRRGSGHALGVLDKHRGRRCDGLAEYAPHVRALVRAHAIHAVFIATDDQRVVSEAQARAAELLGVRGAERVYALELNRSMYYVGHMDDVVAAGNAASGGGGGGAGRGGGGDRRSDLRSSFDFGADARAFMTDLLLLADADALVGKHTSNMFRHALALSNAFKGGDCVVPYASLDALWCASHSRPEGRSFVLDKRMRETPPGGLPFMC